MYIPLVSLKFIWNNNTATKNIWIWKWKQNYSWKIKDTYLKFLISRLRDDKTFYKKYWEAEELHLIQVILVCAFRKTKKGIIILQVWAIFNISKFLAHCLKGTSICQKLFQSLHWTEIPWLRLENLTLEVLSYLHYKTITSQNVSPEIQVWLICAKCTILYFVKKFCFILEIFKFFF